MKESSTSNYNNYNEKDNNTQEMKIYPTTFPTKELSNTVVNINTIHKKNNSSNINNGLTFKITEKECSDINSIVRNSVEKINNLLNSKDINNNNFNKSLKRSSKNCILEILEKEKEKEKILKSRTIKEGEMKTNFTFNINNFINVPNEQNKNDSININKNTERYEDEEEEFGNSNEQTFSEKNKNNCKAKTNQKGCNLNNRTKNNNYINMNYGTNRHNNGKLFRNCVRKKRLFDDGINANYNNNINIINFANRQKNKKKKQLETKDDKDKSITVNTKYKKYNNGNDNTNYINNNLIIKDKNQNQNSLNNSLKNKGKDNILKNSISEDINNNNNSKIKKNNIIDLNNFSPNIININSLSDNRNIKNYILNNKECKSNNNKSKNKYSNANNKKNKSKEKELNKKIFNPSNNNNPINNQMINNSNKSSFAKTFSGKINNKFISINNLNINSNNSDSLSNIDDNEKRKSSNNKPILKKENTGNLKKCGYSCEHIRRNYNSSSQNIHQILNKIYSKEFPNKIKTNNMMKLMLFLNEYLINNNLLDDYYDINNRNKLDNYSKFLCEQINIDFPQENDVNIDKMVSSAKKIQRMWRKKKIEKFIGKNSEENELKKMVINKYIRSAGFKIKKIIGLFNSLVDDFNNIENEKETEEMFYNIQQLIKRKLTPYEKNNLYKEYINSIIYLIP